MELTVRPERLVAGGEALARQEGGDHPGRVVFVDGALPGELVRVHLTSSKKDYARATLVEVLERSQDRDAPSCAHRRAGCGGCDWMHLQPAAQLDAKVEIIRESLRRIGRIDAGTVDALVVAGGSVDQFGYRTTIRVVGGPGGTLGFREHASDRVVPVTSCPIAASKLSRLLAVIEVDEGAEVTLRTSIATGAITAIWDRRHRGAVRGLPSEVHIGERAWLTERIAGRDLRVSAPSFFQSGAQAAELLVAAVGRAAPELAGARHGLDAYGGVGLFAATAMADVERVTVVESSRWACRDAEHNLTGREARVVRAEVTGWTPPSGQGPTPPIDVVVADPARSGLGRPGVEALAAAAAPVLVLVSCDPVSLARDTVLLADAGYRPERIEVVDLFPNTHHVEAVARIVRA